MGPVTISERFTTACSPVISSNYDTCGTVTRATVSHLTASQLTALFAPGGLFADLDAWFFHSIEMKACGVRRYALYDWIMANADREMYRNAVTGIKAVKSPSLVQPFIFGRQESVVNRDYFKVTAGQAQSAYTADVTGPLTTADLALGAATDRVVRVESRHSIPLDAGFFRSRDALHIFGSSSGITQHGQWKVLASASDSTLTYVDVLMTSQNAGSTEHYDLTPTTGVVIMGINNVNDYESWCKNRPTIDPRKRVPFWVQTFRRTRCVDSEYKEVYKRLYDSNPAFREFGDLPLSERNRQDELEEQHRFVHDFFFNKPINGFQTVNAWESLDPIYTVAGAVLDPGLSGKLISRRANFVGVVEQLRVCDRVFDIQNNPLNFGEFLDLNYDIMRARKSQGKKVTDIDWWTDSIFRARFQTAAFGYYKDQYLDQLRVTVELGKMNELGMIYDSYYFKRPAGVRINVMSDEFFDDYRAEFDAQGIEHVGTLMMALELAKPGPNGGSVYYAQIAANRKVYTTAKIEELAKYDSTYRCVLETTSIEQSLTSETGTVVVECPLNNAIIRGIADADPVLTPGLPPYSNLY